MVNIKTAMEIANNVQELNVKFVSQQHQTYVNLVQKNSHFYMKENVWK